MSTCAGPVARKVVAALEAVGTKPSLIRLFELMQASRMGMYAYVNHQHNMVMLAGIPDMPASLPHSRGNQ